MITLPNVLYPVDIFRPYELRMHHLQSLRRKHMCTTSARTSKSSYCQFHYAVHVLCTYSPIVPSICFYFIRSTTFPAYFYSFLFFFFLSLFPFFLKKNIQTNFLHDVVPNQVFDKSIVIAIVCSPCKSLVRPLCRLRC